MSYTPEQIRELPND